MAELKYNPVPHDHKALLAKARARKGFDEASKPASEDPTTAEDLTRKYSDQIGTVLKTVNGIDAGYELDGTELYVRAVVTSSRVHPNPSEAGEFERAWVQPYVPTIAK